jgi:hypothetical protein
MGQSNVGLSSSNVPGNSGKVEKKIMGMLNGTRGVSEKILATLPKTLKIFQMIINVEHSLGEFRKLLLPAFVKVLDDNEVCGLLLGLGSEG